jgi:hypothetical protein
MSAELKELHIYDMQMYRLFPEDIRYFGGILEAAIGPVNAEGSDRFSALVCTPSWFEGNVLTQKPQDPTHETFYEAAFGTHHLFVLEFDEAVIREAVKRLARYMDEVSGRRQSCDFLDT